MGRDNSRLVPIFLQHEVDREGKRGSKAITNVGYVFIKIEIGTVHDDKIHKREHYDIIVIMEIMEIYNISMLY